MMDVEDNNGLPSQLFALSRRQDTRGPNPYRGMRGLNGLLDRSDKLVPDRFKIDCLPQTGAERGDDRLGVVAGTVEAPVNKTLHPKTQPIEQRRSR